MGTTRERFAAKERSISSCSAISRKALFRLLRGSPDLQLLYVEGCTRLPPVAVLSLIIGTYPPLTKLEQIEFDYGLDDDQETSCEGLTLHRLVRTVFRHCPALKCEAFYFIVSI